MTRVSLLLTAAILSIPNLAHARLIRVGQATILDSAHCSRKVVTFDDAAYRAISCGTQSTSATPSYQVVFTDYLAPGAPVQRRYGIHWDTANPNTTIRRATWEVAAVAYPSSAAVRQNGPAGSRLLRSTSRGVNLSTFAFGPQTQCIVNATTQQCCTTTDCEGAIVHIFVGLTPLGSQPSDSFTSTAGARIVGVEVTPVP